MLYVGIDLGGTGIKAGLVNEEGTIVARAECPTGVERGHEAVIADMAKLALDVIAKGGATLDEVKAVGIGLPGIQDPRTGHVPFCTNLYWHDVPVVELMQKVIDKPIYIGNDATVAGLAESVAGVSKGYATSVFITLGTGVGGGIVIGGRPWSGFHGVGSEIGHIPMDIGGEPCSCGNYGCLERYCSATAVIRMGKQMVLQHPDSLMYDLCGGDVSKLTAKMVFDAAKELDDVAMKVFNHYVDYLCKAIYTIIAFLDPEMIVLGGGISKSGDFLLNAVRERIPRYLLFKTLPYSRVEIARLGADAGMIGAAMLGRHA